jgi:hypothetical protein
VFPVRYALDLCTLCTSNSIFKGLNTSGGRVFHRAVSRTASGVFRRL